ncbi:MAG: ribosome maturation factor RimP [Acholeplasmataceae bacterium]
MNLDRIKEKLNPILESKGLTFHSIRRKREFGENIVEVLIDGFPIDSNMLEGIHRELIDKLSDDDLDPRYYLELSTVGLERPITTKDDLALAIERYIYLESPKYRGNGTLKAFDGETIELYINDKGRFKTISINYRYASKIRFAVKF